MTPSDLYRMGMESDTAYKHMSELCELLGVPYPPYPDDFTEIDFQKGLQPPVSAAFK